MRCFFTLLAMMVLTVVSASAQYQQPGDTSVIGIQIPDREFEEIRTHPPTMFMNYSYSVGIPTLALRLHYQPSVTLTKDSIALDFVATDPGQTSHYFKQLKHPVDPTDPKTTWQSVGWVRADLDADGRVIRLWGQDALDRYWLWRGSLPFSTTTVPDRVTPKAEVE
jgi:hypothetical protein